MQVVVERIQNNKGGGAGGRQANSNCVVSSWLRTQSRSMAGIVSESRRRGLVASSFHTLFRMD